MFIKFYAVCFSCPSALYKSIFIILRPVIHHINFLVYLFVSQTHNMAHITGHLWK